jgi:hypothetical protein
MGDPIGAVSFSANVLLTGKTLDDVSDATGNRLKVYCS